MIRHQDHGHGIEQQRRQRQPDAPAAARHALDRLAIGAEQRLALAGVIGLEALGVGLGTAAFVAFIARSTHPSYTATQFALFTSLAAVPRTFINATTGYLIEWLGYVSFFWACFFLAVPGMLLLFWVAPWNGDNKPATPADKAEAA